MPAVYRYDFKPEIPIEDIEASMVLALVGAEALHGETEVQLATCHAMDVQQRSCVIDAESAVGQDVNRLFACFLRREFGAEAFSLRRVSQPAAVSPAA